MKTWKLEAARDRFAEVARRALAHQPQRIALGPDKAVIVVDAADYAVLTFARDLVEFARRTMTPATVQEPEVAQRARRSSKETAAVPLEDG